MRFVSVYVGAVFYKNVGNLLMTYVTDGFSASGVLSDVLGIGFYILLELLQTAIVTLIAAKLIGAAKERERIRMDAAVAARKDYVPATEYLPFSKLLNFKNPLQKSAFWVAFVPMLVHVLQRAYYDVFYTIVEGFYGSVLVDILWMLLYYTLDVVAYGVVVYFIELLLVSKFGKIDEKLQKKQTETETDEIFGS